jgi:tetratricopeptide (TPR) repeat protein
MRVLLALLLTLAFFAVISATAWFAWQKYDPIQHQETVPVSLPLQAGPPSQDNTGRLPSSVETVTPSSAAQSSPAPEMSPETPDLSSPSPEEDTAKDIIDRAVADLEAGRYRDALRGFELALPHTSSALAGIGVSYFQLEDYRNAIHYLERALQENGDDPVVLKFLALAHYRIDNLEKSADYAERSLAMRPNAELLAFYQKLSRERQATRNRVDESNLHFKVIFDGYEHGSISYMILDILDDAYREIGREFGHFPDKTITVVLYTEKDFFDVTQTPQWTGGLYDGKIRMPIKGIESVDSEVLRRVLHHEYVHAMVHDISAQVPRWVHEGLAEYLAPRNMERIGQTIPLRMLDNAFHSHDTRVVGIAYQQSYSIIAHLVERYSLYDVKQFLLAMGRGSTMEQAFHDTFIITFDEFASTWGKD